MHNLAEMLQILEGSNTDKLPYELQLEAIDALDDLLRQLKYNYAKSLYPEEGPLRRELYKKHMEFYEATRDYSEVGAICANRVGKTLMATYAVKCWATGLYPTWWPGRMFKHPTSSWVAGTTNETTRDILQKSLLGAPGHLGEGLIPMSHIVGRPRPRTGVPDAVESVRIRSEFGGYSTIGFKSYNQGRKSVEGTEKHVILLDEEPPEDFYNECLLRTMTTNGIVCTTFTPLVGLSKVVLQFLPHMDPERQDEEQ